MLMQVSQQHAAQAPAERLPRPPAVNHDPGAVQHTIDEACAPVYNLGVPAGRFTLDSVLNVGLTSDAFIKGVGSFLQGKDDEQLDLLFGRAIQHHILTSIRTMTTQPLWNVINFYKAPAERQVLEDISR